MILDLILKDNFYLLKIHHNFLKNKSMPLTLFQADIPLMKKYDYLGVFQTGDADFGFDGCFRKRAQEADYLIYEFKISPEITSELAMRQMLLTIHLCTFYVVESMYDSREFFAETVWDNQSLSFVVFDGGQLLDGYSIGGNLYPWFKQSLATLNDPDLNELNEYVNTELKRIYYYLYRQELSYSQATISRESFFIQVNMGGRWLSWNKCQAEHKTEEFSSHNIDHRRDQELCFAGIIAINTWLREHQNKKAE